MNDGGPAFPNPKEEEIMLTDSNLQEVEQEKGMSLRDYFAAKAMQAQISLLDPCASGWDWPMITKESYRIAEAMLESRAQK